MPEIVTGKFIVGLRAFFSKIFSVSCRFITLVQPYPTFCLLPHHQLTIGFHSCLTNVDRIYIFLGAPAHNQKERKKLSWDLCVCVQDTEQCRDLPGETTQQQQRVLQGRPGNS